MLAHISAAAPSRPPHVLDRIHPQAHQPPFRSYPESEHDWSPQRCPHSATVTAISHWGHLCPPVFWKQKLWSHNLKARLNHVLLPKPQEASLLHPVQTPKPSPPREVHGASRAVPPVHAAPATRAPCPALLECDSPMLCQPGSPQLRVSVLLTPALCLCQVTSGNSPRPCSLTQT